MLVGAGRSLRNHGRQTARLGSRQQDVSTARSFGRAEQGSEVLRVLHLIECQDEIGRVFLDCRIPVVERSERTLSKLSHDTLMIASTGQEVETILVGPNHRNLLSFSYLEQLFGKPSSILHNADSLNGGSSFESFGDRMATENYRAFFSHFAPSGVSTTVIPFASSRSLRRSDSAQFF